MDSTRYDVFLSHATEDKPVARRLYDRLTAAGLRIWFDERVLMLGEGVRAGIDQGLSRSAHGLLLLTPTFFAKTWTKAELDALVAADTVGTKVLPVLHDMTIDDLRRVSPIMAGKVALSTADGLDAVCASVLAACRPGASLPARAHATPSQVTVTRSQGPFYTRLEAVFWLDFKHRLAYERKDRFIAGGDVTLRADDEEVFRANLWQAAVGHTRAEFTLEGLPCDLTIVGLGVGMRVTVRVNGQRLMRF